MQFILQLAMGWTTGGGGQQFCSLKIVQTVFGAHSGLFPQGLGGRCVTIIRSEMQTCVSGVRGNFHVTHSRIC
jgi:hypothetical protein